MPSNISIAPVISPSTNTAFICSAVPAAATNAAPDATKIAVGEFGPTTNRRVCANNPNTIGAIIAAYKPITGGTPTIAASANALGTVTAVTTIAATISYGKYCSLYRNTLGNLLRIWFYDTDQR